MYLGRIVEYTDKRTLFTRPLHPYTEALLPAVPVPDPRDQAHRSACCRATCRARSIRRPGCHFHTRCPYAVERCRVEIAGIARGEAGAAGGVSFALASCDYNETYKILSASGGS